MAAARNGCARRRVAQFHAKVVREMKVWITKYALTQGIKEMDVEVINNKMVAQGRHYFHGRGREWHRTREGAQAKAEQMRRDRIDSLKKTLAKLEKLSFS